VEVLLDGHLPVLKDDERVARIRGADALDCLLLPEVLGAHVQFLHEAHGNRATRVMLEGPNGIDEVPRLIELSDCEPSVSWKEMIND
jgi:hypothetical protein